MRQGRAKKSKTHPDNIEIINAPEVILMDEPAALSIRKKRNSSIIRGIELLKNNKADAFLAPETPGR